MHYLIGEIIDSDSSRRGVENVREWNLARRSHQYIRRRSFRPRGKAAGEHLVKPTYEIST